MLMLILSAVLGVLAAKVLDNSKFKFKPYICVFSIVFIILLTIIFELINATQSALQRNPLNLLSHFEEYPFFQAILISVVLIIITIVDYQDPSFLSFKKYSKKIIEFTKKTKANSIIKIIAGDMDFFGGIQVDDIEISNKMEQSEEYQQLLDLKNEKNGAQFKILCSHGLENEKATFDAIINGTASPKRLYSDYRSENSLNHATFQQLLRIGKIKSDFKSSVEIRFYNEKNTDNELRARFIDQEGIVYRKERVHERRKIHFQNTFPFISFNLGYEDYYSVSNITLQEYTYYNDIYNLKWEKCDKEECEKIVDFCELLYRFVKQKDPYFHMALIYVNSYEIARKKTRKEFPPFGVMYLAASVREEPDWDVELIAVDEHTSDRDLKSWTKYDAIGFSIISSYSYDILKQCYISSKKKKDVVIFAGGYQACRFSNDVFHDFETEFIIVGEGEDTIRNFCRHFKNRNYAEIEGIMYRDINKTIHTNSGPLCVDIDKIPFPARDLIKQEDCVMNNRLAGTDCKMVHMLFSRGCSYNCFYCAANQDGKVNQIRYRNKQHIVNELQELKKQYDIDGFSIIDDCFLTNQQKAIEICNYIAEQKLNLKWSLTARVDHINDEVLEALHNSGCIEIKFGVETGSDDLLKSMNKLETVEDAENAIKKTHKKGIGVKLFIITGLPFESDKTHEETKQFLSRMYSEKLVDRVSLLRFTPLPGSVIYAQPEKYGINPNALNSINFSKVKLYRDSYDWWIEKDRFSKCEKWYQDLKDFINERWGDL